ncbi:MAG: TonB-dependent receptor plug domain-containing protein [Steroidobacteraceae bacterium]
MTCVKKVSFLIAGIGLILGMTDVAISQTTSAEPPTTAATSATPDAGQLQEVVVTGTLIQQPDLESAVPISVVSPVALQATGNVAIVQAFRNLPEFGSASASTDTNIGGGGEQTLNLRNLGNQRTLDLIDGRRFAGFTDSVGNAGEVMDVGMIPKSLIDHVDVERDGAGPTYGSDAVAGVVNFILDQNFHGFSLNTDEGISGHGDGASYGLSSKLGFGNERGSVVIGGDWEGTNPINADSRDWLTNYVTGITHTVTRDAPVGPGGQIYAANGRTIIACYPNRGGASVAPNCPRYDVNGAGNFDLDSGTTVRDVGVLSHYNITDNVTFEAQVFYTDRQNQGLVGAYNLNSTATFGQYGGGFAIPASSPNNPFGQDVRVKWNTLQAGLNYQLTDASLLWSTVGFKGTLAQRWHWDVLQTNSRTTSNQQYLAYPNATSIRNLFIPADCATDPLCASVGAIGNLNTFFSGGAHLTPDQIHYGWFDQMVTSTYAVQQTTSTINGPLFNLPAGSVLAALGVEYRRTSGEQIADPITESLDSARAVILPWDQGYSTDEGYGELQLPLLKNAPFARSLDLDLQARFTHFSAVDTDLGNATTWKIGLSYAPSDDIRFRAAEGTSFRAPTPFDLYRGGNLSMNGGTDPCNPGGIRTTNATVNRNCIAAGAPVGPVPANPIILVNSGGSPSLQPEQGRSITVGTVFTPRFVPNLSMTLDYYRISVDEAIGTTNLTQALDTCYENPDFIALSADPSNSCFGYANRNVDQSLARLPLYAINVNREQTSGLDYSADYLVRNLGVIPGSISIDANANWIASFYSSNSIPTQQVGLYNTPRWSGTLSPSYHLRNFTFGWFARLISSMQDPAVLRGSIPADNPLGYTGTPFYILHDMTAAWHSNDNTYHVTFGINNVFDKDPPFALNVFGDGDNTLSSTYDIIGRYFYVDAGVKF